MACSQRRIHAAILETGASVTAPGDHRAREEVTIRADLGTSDLGRSDGSGYPVSTALMDT